MTITPILNILLLHLKKAIKKLINLNISPPKSWHSILFIIALFNA